MTPKVIVGPVEEPISIEEARAHLEAAAYEDSDIDPTDDVMLSAWIGAAREHCENYLGLSLATKTLEVALDQFPGHERCGWWTSDERRRHLGLELPMGPVREILSVTVPHDDFDSDDVDSDSMADSAVWADGTVNPDQYALDDYSHPNRVYPVGSWPTLTRSTNAVKVRYLAGYGVDSDGGEELPKSIRAAILLVLGHLFANREASTDLVLMTIPLGANVLMNPYRVRLGMA